VKSERDSSLAAERPAAEAAADGEARNDNVMQADPTLKTRGGAPEKAKADPSLFSRTAAAELPRDDSVFFCAIQGGKASGLPRKNSSAGRPELQSRALAAEGAT